MILKVPYMCDHPTCDVVQYHKPGLTFIICDGKYGRSGELRHAPMVAKEQPREEAA